MIICERCGAENLDTAAACVRCHRPLTTAGSQQLPLLREMLEEQRKQSKSLGRIELWLTIFGLLVFLEVLLSALMLFGVIR